MKGNSFVEESYVYGIYSLMKNKTWELVDKPEGNRVIGYKQIFKIKNKGGRTDKV